MVQTALPIDAHVDEIVSHVRKYRTAVIIAPPGSGKTTRIAPALTAIGRTIMLQPRPAAARDDLAIVVMSATLDATAISRYLGHAKVFDVAAPTFPVEIEYAPNKSLHDVIPPAGDVLVFLPGAREIERAAGDLRGLETLPLHGSLDVDAQEKALAPSRSRKIILSTNIAETSLTVEGVRTVIDTGTHKVLRFDPETAIDHLVLERISADSATQRAGRAGRTAPGRAIRMWDERDILRPHREPEVQRIDLAPAVLDILAWDGDPKTFEWFERPPEDRIDAAIALVIQL